MRELPIAVVALGILAGLARGAEIQFVPLQKYIEQPGVTGDPVGLGYVAERCSALYAVFAKDLETETAPDRRKFRAEAVSTGEKFMGIAVQLMMRGSTIEMKEAFARTSKIVVDLGNLYVDRIEAARLRTGNMFADNLIAGDFATCKGLLAKM